MNALIQHEAWAGDPSIEIGSVGYASPLLAHFVNDKNCKIIHGNHPLLGAVAH
jgi:hypothetical protein